MIPPPQSALLAAVDFGVEETTVTLGGEIDLLTAPQLAGVFDEVAGQRPRRVIVDVADVTFLGVAGLDLLASLAGRLRAANGALVVRSASTLTRRLLDLIDLGEVAENTPPPPPAAPTSPGGGVRSLVEIRPTPPSGTSASFAPPSTWSSPGPPPPPTRTASASPCTGEAG